MHFLRQFKTENDSSHKQSDYTTTKTSCVLIHNKVQIKGICIFEKKVTIFFENGFQTQSNPKTTNSGVSAILPASNTSSYRCKLLIVDKIRNLFQHLPIKAS